MLAGLIYKPAKSKHLALHKRFYIECCWDAGASKCSQSGVPGPEPNSERGRPELNVSGKAVTSMSSESPKPEIEGVSIVAVGKFNPAIFQPHWFSENSLIKKEEAKEAGLGVIHDEITQFKTNWFSLQVTTDKYMISTQDPAAYPRVRDLVVGTFTLLEHTPINQFGFNKFQHFRMPSEEDWHAYGHYYAPKGSWEAIVSGPGMRSLIIQGHRKNCPATNIQIKTEPSQQLKHAVFIHVNEHYDMKCDTAEESKDGVQELLRTLTESWDDILSYGDTVSSHLLEEYYKSKG